MKSIGSVEVIALQPEENWEERLNPYIGTLEKQLPPEPLIAIERLQVVEKLEKETFPKTCYAVIVYTGVEPIGYGIFHCTKDTQRFSHPLTLRACDDVYFMAIPFWRVLPENTQQVIQIFLENRKLLHKKTGADLVAWYSLHTPAIEPYEFLLKPFGEKQNQGVYPLLLLPQENLTAYLEQNHLHEMKDFRKQIKRIHNTYKREPLLIEADISSRDNFMEAFNRLTEIRKKTWQYTWENESGMVNRELYEKKLFASCSIWRDMHVLKLYFLTLDGRDIAFWCILQQGTRVWCLLIGFNQEFKSYSPGRLVFIKGLQTVHASGGREFALGGSVLGWKEAWAQEPGELCRYEFWTSGGKALLYTGKKKLFRLLKRHA